MKKEKTPVKKISKVKQWVPSRRQTLMLVVVLQRGHRGKAESKTVVDEDKGDTKPDDDNLYS